MRKLNSLLCCIAFLLLLLVSLGLYLFNSCTTLQQYADSIKELKTELTNLQLKVMLVQVGQIQHYDDITLAQNSLNNRISALPDSEKQALLLSWQTFNQNVEQFKTAQAVFINSSVYFPVASQSLVHIMIETGQHKEFIKALKQLQKQLYQLLLRRELDTVHSSHQIEHLKQLALGLPDKTRQRAQTVIRHAEMLLKNFIIIERVNAALLSTEIPAIANNMLVTLDKKIQSHKQWLVFTALAMSMLALLLVLLIIYEIGKQRI